MTVTADRPREPRVHRDIHKGARGPQRSPQSTPLPQARAPARRGAMTFQQKEVRVSSPGSHTAKAPSAAHFRPRPGSHDRA